MEDSKFLAGLTPFDDFARSLHKHPKTVKRMQPPIVRIGRSLYVPDAQGLEWVRNGCRPVVEQPPRRGRRTTSGGEAV
jgi:hypothetical protein